MFITQQVIEIDSSSGTGDTELTVPVVGRVLSIRYVKPASGGLDTATIVITTKTSGVTILSESGINASETWLPRQQVSDTAGAGIWYNDDGDEPVSEPIYVADEQIQVVVSSVSNNKTGTFYITIG